MRNSCSSCRAIYTYYSHWQVLGCKIWLSPHSPQTLAYNRNLIINLQPYIILYYRLVQCTHRLRVYVYAKRFALTNDRGNAPRKKISQFRFKRWDRYTLFYVNKVVTDYPLTCCILNRSLSINSMWHSILFRRRNVYGVHVLHYTATNTTAAKRFKYLTPRNHKSIDVPRTGLLQNRIGYCID